jgi:hypothetical protein
MIIIIWACSTISSNICLFDLTTLINGTTYLGSSPISFPPKHENINPIHIMGCMWSYCWTQASRIVSIWTLNNLCSTSISYRLGGLGAIRSLGFTTINELLPKGKGIFSQMLQLIQCALCILLASMEVTQGNIKPPSLIKATLATNFFLLSRLGFLIPKSLHSFSYRDLMQYTFSKRLHYNTKYRN